MQMTAHRKKRAIFLKQKIHCTIWLLFSLLFSFSAFSQNITLSLKRVSLERAFREIEKRTDHRFVYTKEMTSQGNPVTLDVKNEPLNKVLELIFNRQPLEFSLDEKFITVRFKLDPSTPGSYDISLSGRVINENDEPIAGASVTVKGSSMATTCDEDGQFTLLSLSENSIITVSSIGYLRKEIPIGNRRNIEVTLAISVSSLDETVVIAYGTTTRRFNTGSVSKIGAREIGIQPVSNPIAALHGRVPGLTISQTSGVPGSSFRIQIRGQNSINPDPNASSGLQPFDNPLFIIDGVPFAPQNKNINQFSSLAAPGTLQPYANPYGGMSPFNSINPADIESIEILRDADATAIYGSRGANGVIIITTKRGKAGKTSFDLNIYSGQSRVTRTMPMMNTMQYLEMRREAFKNDGINPSNTPGTSAYAPDILLFDTSRYTNWKKYFLGGTARTTDAHATLSGGNTSTQFLVGVGYHNETYIFPGDFNTNRLSINSNFRHSSFDKRFVLDFSSNYSYDQNNSSGSAKVLQAFTLPPNYPELINQDGSLNWNYNGVDLIDNPVGYLKQKYTAKNYNLISHLEVGYEILKGLSLRSSFGFNTYNGNETSQIPKLSQAPSLNLSSYADFGKNDFQTWIIEPQAEYKVSHQTGKFNILFGGTFQQNTNSSSTINGSNYPNDALLGSISAAANITSGDSYNQYKYTAIFGRINYIWNNRFILNLNVRRDGSSRFGPGKQFGNFGSIGSGWIFSQDSLIKKKFPFVSYGKLRSSYGTTGNDNIGNYQYLSRWESSGNPYQGSTAYLPQNLYNPEFSWSVTKKLEAGIDLGFFDDRILTTITWFRHRSGNQLVRYQLPSQTGFSGVTANFPAVVQNNGWEFSLSAVLLKRKKFSWSASFNLTIPKNKLLSFPGIENSSYLYSYVVGQSLNLLNVLNYLGVNDSSGIYEYQSKTGPTPNPVPGPDSYPIGNLDPKYYGGLRNVFKYKGFELETFLEFKKQTGPNYLQQVNAYPPGFQFNMPVSVLERWQKPGDTNDIQKFTSRTGTQAYMAASNFAASSGVYGDASYIRFKSLSISYSLRDLRVGKGQTKGLRVYASSQNLFTITNYKGNDPETLSFYSLPPLKTIVAGLQFTF